MQNVTVICYKIVTLLTKRVIWLQLINDPLWLSVWISRYVERKFILARTTVRIVFRILNFGTAYAAVSVLRDLIDNEANRKY
jgi:hypothetical protein